MKKPKVRKVSTLVLTEGLEIVMESQRNNLQSLIDHLGPFSERKAAEIILQMIGALEYLKEQDYIC